MTLKFHPDMSLPTEPNSLFVFGSNLAGMHGGGSARYAHDKLGAVWGDYFGVTGQCFAIPTCDSNCAPLPFEVIELYFSRFVQYTLEHPDVNFFMTRVGCGIAGFSDEAIAGLIAYQNLHNFDCPIEWKPFLGERP